MGLRGQRATRNTSPPAPVPVSRERPPETAAGWPIPLTPVRPLRFCAQVSLKRRTWNDRRPNWYCPEPFAENRPEILRTLIQRYPLATLVSMGGNGLEANRIPLYPVCMVKDRNRCCRDMWPALIRSGGKCPRTARCWPSSRGRNTISAPRGTRPRWKPARWYLPGTMPSSMLGALCKSGMTPLGA